MADIDLLRRAKQLDRQALAKIYDCYSPALYAYALRLLGDACLAEDCVAETFRRFLAALQNGGGPRDYLQAYLYRIAHNWITDQYRRQPPPPLPLDDGVSLPSREQPEQQAARSMQQQQVRAALRCLTPDQRQVILLKFLEGWENEAIAAALQKPVGAVKSLQHRALQALKRILVSAEEIEHESLS
jgi:RNA polymerase sigma-70 factor (ECF subfamily)